jgi:hypothetical protein
MRKNSLVSLALSVILVLAFAARASAKTVAIQYLAFEMPSGWKLTLHKRNAVLMESPDGKSQFAYFIGDANGRSQEQVIAEYAEPYGDSIIKSANSPNAFGISEGKKMTVVVANLGAKSTVLEGKYTLMLEAYETDKGEYECGAIRNSVKSSEASYPFGVAGFPPGLPDSGAVAARVIGTGYFTILSRPGWNVTNRDANSVTLLSANGRCELTIGVYNKEGLSAAQFAAKLAKRHKVQATKFEGGQDGYVYKEGGKTLTGTVYPVATNPNVYGMTVIGYTSENDRELKEMNEIAGTLQMK